MQLWSCHRLLNEGHRKVLGSTPMLSTIFRGPPARGKCLQNTSLQVEILSGLPIQEIDYHGYMMVYFYGIE